MAAILGLGGAVAEPAARVVTQPVELAAVAAADRPHPLIRRLDIRHRQPSFREQPAEKKEPTGTNITTPKQELPGGTEAFRTLIESCGDSQTDLGYSSATPPYYVLMAVMADWLNGRAA